MMASFVTLIIWLMSGRQKKAFDDASQIPLGDDSDFDTSTSSNGGDNHE
jgi:cbb3-type cytochrome oxidase subunit 3